MYMRVVGKKETLLGSAELRIKKIKKIREKKVRCCSLG